jgi:hypothetical protein
MGGRTSQLNKKGRNKLPIPELICASPYVKSLHQAEMATTHTPHERYQTRTLLLSETTLHAEDQLARIARHSHLEGIFRRNIPHPTTPVPP